MGQSTILRATPGNILSLSRVGVVTSEDSSVQPSQNDGALQCLSQSGLSTGKMKSESHSVILWLVLLSKLGIGVEWNRLTQDH